jgi:hypothetical protein
MSDTKIYIVDQITPNPGEAEAFLNLYMERYAPGARERGMTLEFTWVSPPTWLKDQSNTLFIIWSVPDAKAWWAMSHGGKRDPVVQAWWRDAESMIEKRHRCFLTDVSAVAKLANV